jgi:hypothetical protein
MPGCASNGARFSPLTKGTPMLRPRSNSRRRVNRPTVTKAPPALQLKTPSTFRLAEPGCYSGVPMAVYHGDLCEGLSVSASTLVLMHRTCPARAWAHHYANPAAVPSVDTDATVFGTQAHALIIEGRAAFERRYAVRPHGMNLTTTEGRLWKALHSGLEHVTQPDWNDMVGMQFALSAHPAARHAFSEGAAEVTCTVHDDDTGLWLKCRPDYLRDGLALNYKTTRMASREAWRNQAHTLGYHIGAAFTVDVLAKLGLKVNYAFVVQEKTFPYLPAVRVLDDDFLDAGRQIYKRALVEFAEHAEKNDWPGYDSVETVSLPPWAGRGEFA